MFSRAFSLKNGLLGQAVGLVNSVPVITVCLLVIIEILLRQGNLLDSLGYRTVDLWGLPPRINICRKTSPDLAIIGSSLLLTLNLHPQEHFTFCRLFPPYLQKRLRELTRENVTTINMCTGSQVPSEGYLITQALLNQSNPPKTIIYGLSLRDFNENRYLLEWRCDSFASIAPFVPVTADVLEQLNGLLAVKEFLLSHFFFLYRNRTDFANFVAAITKNWLEYLPLDQSFERVQKNDYRHAPSRSGRLWEEWVPRKRFESQYQRNPEMVRKLFFDMHAVVYSHGDEATRAIGAHYLEALASLCKQKGVDLVIVNMPLSKEIMDLAPPGFNDAFRNYLSMVADRYNAQFIDLLSTSQFPSHLFSDGVHLNYAGSLSFVDKLLAELSSKHPLVIEHLSEHARLRLKSPDTKRKQEEPYSHDTLIY